MAVEVIIPKVDMDMESAAIQSWKVGEGDRVEAGDVLFEITTNKAAMEVEAPASGIVRGIAATDHALPVGSVVAWICQPEEQPPCPSLADTGQTASANPPATVSLEREGAVAGLYTGGGWDLAEAGAFFFGDLSPWQARIVLAAALAVEGTAEGVERRCRVWLQEVGAIPGQVE